MNRLTFEGNFCDIAMCRETPLGSFCEDGYCSQRKVWERLKQYEDTRLEPEEIKELCEDDVFETAKMLRMLIVSGEINHLQDIIKAEQAGRLVVLPCKVGDIVYIPDLEKKIPVKVRVQGISISVSGRTILRLGGYPAESAWGDGCGKDWFLTREEAEAELLSKEETK